MCVHVSGVCHDECSLYPDQSSSPDSRLIPLHIDRSSFSSACPPLTTNPSFLHHLSPGLTFPILYSFSQFLLLSISAFHFSFFFLPLYSLPHILLWLSSILIPLFLSSYLCLTLSFSHFLSISAHLSFLSAAQSQRVDDLAGKTPSPTLRKSIMWLNAS